MTAEVNSAAPISEHDTTPAALAPPWSIPISRLSDSAVLPASRSAKSQPVSPDEIPIPILRAGFGQENGRGNPPLTVQGLAASGRDAQAPSQVDPAEAADELPIRLLDEGDEPDNGGKRVNGGPTSPSAARATAATPQPPPEPVPDGDPFERLNLGGLSYEPAADPIEKFGAPAGGAAVPCAAAVANAAAVVELYRQVVPTRRKMAEKKAKEEQLVRGTYAPIALIIAGVCLRYMEAGLFLGRWRFTLADAVSYSIGITLIDLIIIFGALAATSRVLDHGLGPLGQAVLKGTALAIFPSGVAGVVRGAFPAYGTALSWLALFVCYWLLLKHLFEMEFHETGISTVVVFAVRSGLGYPLFLALFAQTINEHPHYKMPPPAYESPSAPASRPANEPS